jgi:hypothetical protein
MRITDLQWIHTLYTNLFGSPKKWRFSVNNLRCKIKTHVFKERIAKQSTDKPYRLLNSFLVKTGCVLLSLTCEMHVVTSYLISMTYDQIIIRRWMAMLLHLFILYQLLPCGNFACMRKLLHTTGTADQSKEGETWVSKHLQIKCCYISKLWY